MSCWLKRGAALRPTFHQIREGLATRLGELSRQASRYRGGFDNPPPAPPDPQVERIIGEARLRLHRIHTEAQHFLPSPADLPNHEFEAFRTVEERRESHARD